MSKHDAADAANDRHAERMADLSEQPDPRDTDPAIAAEYDEWLMDKLIETLARTTAKTLAGGTVSTEQEAWWM